MPKKSSKPPPEPQASPPQGEAEGKPSGSWLRENLEAIVVAVIMALVIRHFCVEAFKIPTGSMEPTLFGNRPAEGINGDRILVNKFIYRFTEPQRWDVIVFKYPLDRTKNYIKRLVGLPGEELKIRGGNIHVNREPEGSPPRWEIARKPRAVQEAIWQELYPSPAWEAAGTWVAAMDSEFRADGSGGTLRPSKGDEAWIRYRPAPDGRPVPGREDENEEGRIRAYRSPQIRELQPPMGELKLAMRAAADGGELRVRLHLDLDRNGEADEDDAVLLFRVPAAPGGKTTASVNGREAASAEYRLEPGREAVLEFWHVDARLWLFAGGRPVLSCDIDPPPYSPEMAARLSVGLAGGRELRIPEMALFRDLFYQEDVRSNGLFGEGHPVRVPPDGFVGMGDNSSSSKDSRLWKRCEVELLDGTVVEGEADSETLVRHDGTGEIEMTDVHGNRRRFARAEVRGFVRERSSPFVSRECLIGQAFMVFWPLQRVHIIR